MISTKATIEKVNEFIDIKMGFAGAIFMGSLVFWINYEHGWDESLTAALKQFFYTLFFGGLFVKMAENLAVGKRSRIMGILYGGIIPMLITAVLTYTVHSIKGTPEPFYSTLPTIIFGWISFTTWAWLKTKESD
jgi:uncharacterized membrane protein required for colicin V production